MKKDPTASDNIRALAFSSPLPKGELWLGTDLLARAGFEDTLDTHFRLAEQLGHEVVSFPVALETEHKPSLGYRFFSVGDLGRATSAVGDRLVAAVVDGPFQELVNRLGMVAVMKDWMRRREAFSKVFETQQSRILELIRRCLDQGVRLVVIADDLAASNGPLLNPADIVSLCGEFYTRAVQLIHAACGRVFWHCCGNITSLIPHISTWGVDGLAAVQHGVNNLIALSEALGPNASLMAGIESELLEEDPPPQKSMDDFKTIVSTLAPSGRLILCSSCGLYRGVYLRRIKKIYAVADNLLT